MAIFETLFLKILNEDMSSGGTGSVWGTVDAGSTGGQFPANNSKGYADGDNRPINPATAVLGSKVKGKKKKKVSFPIARRNSIKM
jgi:hypothetical protein